MAQFRLLHRLSVSIAFIKLTLSQSAGWVLLQVSNKEELQKDSVNSGCSCMTNKVSDKLTTHPSSSLISPKKQQYQHIKKRTDYCNFEYKFTQGGYHDSDYENQKGF